MSIKTAFRTSIAALALGAVAIGGGVFAAAPAASAGTTTGQVQLGSTPTPSTNLVVTDVTVDDLNNVNAPAFIYHPPVGVFRGYFTPNPYVQINPSRIHANDRIQVCATVMAHRYATLPSTLTISGPDYNWIGSVPALPRGATTKVCTGYLRLNFANAARRNLLAFGPNGFFPGQQCHAIKVTAVVPGSSLDSKGFLQDGLPSVCA